MHLSIFIHSLVRFALLATLLSANMSVFAQGRKPGTAQTTAVNSKTSKPECKGGYSGVVTYNKTIKTVHPGPYGSVFDRTYIFQSNIVIRDDGTTQGTIYPEYNGIGGSFSFRGKATAAMSEDLMDLHVSEKDDYCKLTLKGGQDKRRVHCESRLTRQGRAEGTGDVNVFLSFQGSEYKLSLDNPKVNGKSSDISKSSCSGTCGPDKPLNSSSEDIIKNETESGTYTDEMPFDPTNFNRLSGTFTRTDGDENVTITWNLSRCAPPLQIDNVEFEHHVFPNATAWRGIDPLNGSTDGNLVKVKAKVFNNGGETAYATVKFLETTSGQPLPDGAVSVAVKPGEARDVEYEWDTSGYAWDDGQKAKPNREIKVQIEGTNESASAKVKILPKPVIMAHGLWSNAAAWGEYPGYLREAHSFAWHGYAVGADPDHGKMNTGDHPGNVGATNTVYQNAQEEAKQIQFVREQNNAWHVDIVSHSMGGLISRQYINSFMPPVFDGNPAVTHLVMLGTPNQGSPCADTVNQLLEDHGYNDMQAMRELRPIIVRAFNARVTDKKGVKFSILIGAFMPRTCLSDGLWSDGVVPLDSAKYNNTDFGYVFRNHLDLTGKEDFLGFVMPRIAIGPKKATSEKRASLLERRENNFAQVSGDVFERETHGSSAVYYRSASYRTGAETGDEDDTQTNVTTRQKVELPAKSSKEIEIPVNEGSYAGVILVASPAVSAKLIDASGAVVGESPAGRDAMKDLFRMISVNKTVSKGVWTLRLENLAGNAETVFAAGFGGVVTSQFAIQAAKTAAGVVQITAKWTENNAPVIGAKITANVTGQTETIELFDDGHHGDGAPGDGVYGASLDKLASGDHFIEATATAHNLTKTAMAGFTIETKPQPTATDPSQTGPSKRRTR